MQIWIIPADAENKVNLTVLKNSLFISFLFFTLIILYPIITVINEKKRQHFTKTVSLKIIIIKKFCRPILQHDQILSLSNKHFGQSLTMS